MLRSINAAEFSFSDPGWERLSEHALDMVGSLLKREPDDRFPLEEALQHPFCAGVLSEQVRTAAENTFHNFDKALAALEDDGAE